MFLFNKSSTVPLERQTSIDSLVSDPSASTSTSNSEAWLSQCSDASTQGNLSSPEQRERQVPGRRTSVFNLRSRSNTAASSASSLSLASISAAMGRPDSSHWTSQDFRNLTGQTLADFPGVKRALFTRGKRVKRLSGALSPGQEVEETEEMDVSSKRSSVLRRSRKTANQPEASRPRLKHRISSPFDFQHLTHTDRQQFDSIEQASENDLVAGFSAVRASQSPRRDLHGIKADDLRFNNFSSENLSNAGSRPTTASGFRSPPLSPEPRYEHQQPDSPQQSPGWRKLRTARSVESFSQPGITPRSPRLHRHTQSATLQARASSRPSPSFGPLLEDRFDSQLSPPPSRTRSNRDSGIWDQFSPLAPSTGGNQLPTIADESGYFGHAVTTPDDSAIPMTPAYTPDLEDVAEEPETFISPRRAPTPPLKSPKSPRSTFFDSVSSRSTQRTPIARTNSRDSTYRSPKSTSERGTMTRPISQMSDTLGSAIPARRSSIRRPPVPRRSSNTWRGIEESWEDDIDYIYDNALEADCDFDWQHDVDAGHEYHDRDRTPEQRDHEPSLPTVTQRTRSPSMASEEESTLPSNYFHGAFRPSLLVPSPSCVPELESNSAISASTTDTGARTPSDFFGSMDRHVPYTGGEGFCLTPSLLVPQEYKEESREEMYNDILADYEGSDRHFPILDASQSFVSSSRSSHIRSSKRSSYDSSLTSSGQGSGSWSSPVRRSASSSGSLPELVQSRRSRKDFNVVVDKLSEQVASFASFCEDDVEMTEDDDATPPGRASHDRTFFTAAEEDQKTEGMRESVEGEVRASLELARQGSTRSSRAPHHKHALSDSAAKLLDSTPVLQQAPKRSRAASSATALRGAKKPYLSLFPTPPKHSPLTSPISSSSVSPRNF